MRSRGYIKSVYPTKEKIFDSIMSLTNTSKYKSSIIRRKFKETFKTVIKVDQPHSDFQGPF